MQQTIEKLAHQLEYLIEITGRAASWLVLVMVVLMFMVVCLRYFFDMGWIALQEAVSYLHACVFMLGASYTLKHNAHVRVDIFYARLSETGKAWVELLGHLLILIPVMVFIIWVSWPYVSESWQVSESSRQAGGLPGVYLLKSLILLMAVLLIIQGVAMLLRAFNRIRGVEVESSC